MAAYIAAPLQVAEPPGHHIVAKGSDHKGIECLTPGRHQAGGKHPSPAQATHPKPGNQEYGNGREPPERRPLQGIPNPGQRDVAQRQT